MSDSKFPLFLKIWLICSAALLVLSVYMVHQENSKRSQRIASARVYMSRQPVFKSLHSLAHFVSSRFGEYNPEAGHYVYRVIIYGHVQCVQAVWHPAFLSPDYYSYHVFSCSNPSTHPSKGDSQYGQ